jgi:hypothetical protein
VGGGGDEKNAVLQGRASLIKNLFPLQGEDFREMSFLSSSKLKRFLQNAASELLLTAAVYHYSNIPLRI